jgi:hypothetical protein
MTKTVLSAEESITPACPSNFDSEQLVSKPNDSHRQTAVNHDISLHRKMGME